MERRPSRKSGESRQKRMPTKRRVLLTALILLSVLLVGNYVRLKVVAYQEKKRFDTSEQQIDTLTERIINRFGEPIKQEKSKRCRYASAKYGRGRLSCSVTSSVTYPVSDHSHAENLVFTIDNYIEQQQQLVRRTSELYFYGPERAFQALDEQHMNEATNSFGFLTPKAFDLNVQYVHSASSEKNESLELRMNSSARALTEHYPVLD